MLKLLERPMGFSSNALVFVRGRSCSSGIEEDGGAYAASFTSLGSYFFFLSAGLRAGGLGGGAPSSGNSLHLNLLPPPMGISSMFVADF